MHHHYQPPHLIEKDFGLSKDGKSTWSLRRRGRNAKTAQSSVGVGGTPTQPNFESRVRRSKFSQFARDGMLVMACIMQMCLPHELHGLHYVDALPHDQLLTFENTRSAGCCPLLLCLKVWLKSGQPWHNPCKNGTYVADIDVLNATAESWKSRPYGQPTPWMMSTLQSGCSSTMKDPECAHSQSW